MITCNITYHAKWKQSLTSGLGSNNVRVSTTTNPQHETDVAATAGSSGVPFNTRNFPSKWFILNAICYAIYPTSSNYTNWKMLLYLMTTIRLSGLGYRAMQNYIGHVWNPFKPTYCLKFIWTWISKIPLKYQWPKYIYSNRHQQFQLHKQASL